MKAEKIKGKEQRKKLHAFQFCSVLFALIHISSFRLHPLLLPSILLN